MRCAECDTKLARVKLFIGGHWLCGDCVYELEYGEVERKAFPPPKPKKAGPPQEEGLFPLPPPETPLRLRQATS